MSLQKMLPTAIAIMQNDGLNLHKVATFIAATFKMGGELSPVTIQIAETIEMLHNPAHRLPVAAPQQGLTPSIHAIGFRHPPIV